MSRYQVELINLAQQPKFQQISTWSKALDASNYLLLVVLHVVITDRSAGQFKFFCSCNLPQLKFGWGEAACRTECTSHITGIKIEKWWLQLHWCAFLPLVCYCLDGYLQVIYHINKKTTFNAGVEFVAREAAGMVLTAFNRQKVGMNHCEFSLHLNKIQDTCEFFRSFDIGQVDKTKLNEQLMFPSLSTLLAFICLLQQHICKSTYYWVGWWTSHFSTFLWK